MKNFFSLFIFTFLTFPLFSTIETSSLLKTKHLGSLLKESEVIPFSEEEQKNWKMAYENVLANGSYVIEWIPANQKIEAWKELLQIQFFPSHEVNHLKAAAFVENFFAYLQENFPSVKTTVIRNTSPEDQLVEWILPVGQNNEAPQSEIDRIISTENGIHRVAYTQKTANLDEATKQKWIQRLSEMTIVKE